MTTTTYPYVVTFSPVGSNAPTSCGGGNSAGVVSAVATPPSDGNNWPTMTLHDEDTIQYAWTDVAGTWSTGDRGTSYQTTLLGLEITSYTVLNESGEPITPTHAVNDVFQIMQGQPLGFSSTIHGRSAHPQCTHYFPMFQTDGGVLQFKDIGRYIEYAVDICYTLWFQSVTTRRGYTSPLYWYYDPEVDIEPPGWGGNPIIKLHWLALRRILRSSRIRLRP